MTQKQQQRTIESNLISFQCPFFRFFSSIVCLSFQCKIMRITIALWEYCPFHYFDSLSYLHLHSPLNWSPFCLLLSSLCICTCAHHTAWPILNFNDSLRINPFAIFILMYLKSDSRASYDPISFEYSLFLLLSSLNRLCEKREYYFVYFTEMASHSSKLPKMKRKNKAKNTL